MAGEVVRHYETWEGPDSTKIDGAESDELSKIVDKTAQNAPKTPKLTHRGIRGGSFFHNDNMYVHDYNTKMPLPPSESTTSLLNRMRPILDKITEDPNESKLGNISYEITIPNGSIEINLANKSYEIRHSGADNIFKVISFRKDFNDKHAELPAKIIEDDQETDEEDTRRLSNFGIC